jgi:uncharacterized protein YbaA (DUF1428 family)
MHHPREEDRMPYVDAFVMPGSADKIEACKEIARTACAVWLEHGALEYWEAVADDTHCEWARPLTELAGTQDGETVVFAWIRYRSRAHRDEVNALVMKDPRITDMPPESMPFDCKRMAYGGFEVMVGGRADA